MKAQQAATQGLTLADVETQLLERLPAYNTGPTLTRIARVMALLGDPQRAYRSVHITGTNGKTSTARMIEALLAASGERTGRLTSPHLTSIRERISIAGEVIDAPAFLSAYTAIAEPAQHVDMTTQHPMSFFEMTVALGYQAFRAAAVDVAVVEVGMGGRWDATNVIDADVAVILPVDLDHTDILGATTTAIAREKAGIIKPGSVAVSARQNADVADILHARARSAGAKIVVEGEDFSLLGRQPVEDGQVISVEGLYGTYADVLLTLRGRHQAENAACAIAAAESMLGRKLAPNVVKSGLARVTSPGRFDVHPGPPPIILDTAHNPHGARALAHSLAELGPRRTFGVIAAMADKDVEGLLRQLEPVIDVLVCTRNSSPRSLTAAELAWSARQVFGAQRIHVARDVATAINVATGFAAPVLDQTPDSLVLVTGSVVTVGDASRFLSQPARGDW